VFIETGSKQYIFVPVVGLTDPTVLPVEMAVVPQDNKPGTSDWVAAQWKAPAPGLPLEAALLRDPAVIPDGEYMAFVRLTATPELIVLPSGRIRIGDTRG